MPWDLAGVVGVVENSRVKTLLGELKVDVSRFRFSFLIGRFLMPSDACQP